MNHPSPTALQHILHINDLYLEPTYEKFSQCHIYPICQAFQIKKIVTCITFAKITEHSSSFAIFKNEAIQKSYRIKDFTISLYPLNYDKKG